MLRKGKIRDLKKWDNVDWNLKLREIALKMGVSVTKAWREKNRIFTLDDWMI